MYKGSTLGVFSVLKRTKVGLLSILRYATNIQEIKVVHLREKLLRYSEIKVVNLQQKSQIFPEIKVVNLQEITQIIPEIKL